MLGSVAIYDRCKNSSGSSSSSNNDKSNENNNRKPAAQLGLRPSYRTALPSSEILLLCGTRARAARSTRRSVRVVSESVQSDPRYGVSVCILQIKPSIYPWASSKASVRAVRGEKKTRTLTNHANTTTVVVCNTWCIPADGTF